MAPSILTVLRKLNRMWSTITTKLPGRFQTMRFEPSILPTLSNIPRRGASNGGNSSDIVHGALIHITVPHFSCSNAFTDPTHRHYFGYSSFDDFTENNDLCFYSSVRFRVRT